MLLLTWNIAILNIHVDTYMFQLTDGIKGLIAKKVSNEFTELDGCAGWSFEWGNTKTTIWESRNFKVPIFWGLSLNFSAYYLFFFNPLTAKYYSIWIFTHLKLCLADANHNFKCVKIIQIWQNGGQLFSNIADRCHILSLTYLKGGT